MSKWIDVEKQKPEQGQEVLCWYEYFSYKKNRMRQTYGLGIWCGDGWYGEVAQGNKAKVLFWTLLPARPRKKYKRKKENAN